MKYLIATLLLFPLGAQAGLFDLLPIFPKPTPTPAPEIDGGLAVVAVVLIGGIGSLVKRAREKQAKRNLI